MNTMHTQKLILPLVFAGLFFGIVSTSAMMEKPEDMENHPNKFLEEILEEKGLDLPADWDEMTREERHSFFEDNDIQLPEPPRHFFKNHDEELPDDWDQKTEDEKQEYRKEKRDEDLQEIFEEKGVDFPEDWDEMTGEERKTFFKEHNIEKKDPQDSFREKNKDLPEDWNEMSQEERDAYWDEKKQAHLEAFFEENNLELPEDWDELTREEHKEFFEENGIKPMGHEGNKKPKKAKNFKKFVGELKAKRNFNDNAKIKNSDAVEFLQRRGIITGYNDGSFGPNNGVTRAESLKMIFESIGEPSTGEVTRSSFSDFKKSEWFAGYVEMAKEKGYVKGYNDGKFRPHQTVNKAELLKIAFQIFEIDLTGYAVDSPANDVANDAWFAGYFQYAIDNQLLDLDANGNINPGESMTRDEFSELIYRLIQQQEAYQDE